MKTASRPKFVAVDFFCGAGGTTSGLIRSGGLVLAGIDNDQRVRETYERNNRNSNTKWRRPKFLQYDLLTRTRDHPCGQQHLVSRDLTALIARAKKAFPHVPLLFSICAPCQPFTKLSKQKITKERLTKHVRDRSLLLKCIDFVREFQPDLVFSENVASITSSKYGEVWRQFETDLGRLDYLTGSSVVDAVNFGIPQNRRRSILLAVRRRRAKIVAPKEGRFSLGVPTSGKRAKLMTVKEAIGHLPRIQAGKGHPTIANHKTRALSETNIRRLKCAKPGETNAYLSTTRFGDLSLKCHRRVNKRLNQRCFNDVYTRMHPDKPSPTITTRCLSVSNGRFAHYDPKQIRPISVREAALLQSFRSGYVFYPKELLEPTARMIGNAVPPRLAAFFARHLLSLIT